MINTATFEKDIVIGNDAINMYEGEKPYVFISYSHQNVSQIVEICNIFWKNHVRFWYDSGLHSGDDWNLVIATHLEKASVCLLLLSQISALSQYVKNELNFAINHRIPIHILLLENFILPIDIEMMIGRIEMVRKNKGYEHRLLKALPSELYNDSFIQDELKTNRIEHPLFQIQFEIMNRQGTTSYLGNHKTLDYKMLIQEEYIINVNIETAKEQAKLVSKLNHSFFPKIYDIVIDGNRMYTFQEYRGEVFLDQYLKDNKMQETQIMKWIDSVIDAIDYLYSLNLGFRDFARGSLIVTNDKKIGIFRLQNIHYGIIRLQQENRQFYFEKEVQEIAVLLYQLCMGELPILPFSIIRNNLFSKRFINKVNLIIQKCVREHHKIQYHNFEEIKTDLNSYKMKIRDILFLKKRQAKLKQYENIKMTNLNKIFTSNDKINIRKNNLEEEFGFEETVVLSCEMNSLFDPIISVLICSTGQLLEFAKTEILIGTSSKCDMILKQPSVSRLHAKICKDANGNYQVEDLNSLNGIFLTSVHETIQSGQRVSVQKGEIIQVGGVKLQLC